MSERPYVWLDPGRCGGEPCVGGDRLTCEHMAQAWWGRGYSLADMLDNWPGLTRGQLLVAWWYQGTRGSRTWRKRWGEWAKAAESALWHGDYDSAPLPPQEGQG